MHFLGTKEQPHAEVLSVLAERRFAELEAAVRLDPADHLRAYFTAFLRRAPEQPDDARLVVRALLDSRGYTDLAIGSLYRPSGGYDAANAGRAVSFARRRTGLCVPDGQSDPVPGHLHSCEHGHVRKGHSARSRRRSPPRWTALLCSMDTAVDLGDQNGRPECCATFDGFMCLHSIF